MTIDTNQHFPLDHLLQCGLCGAPMHLEERPHLAYACAGRAAQPAPCGAPYLRAGEANRHLLRQVMSVIITDSTFGTFREQVGGALAEAGQAPPEEDELRRTAADPGWLLVPEQAVEAGTILGRFIDRIWVHPGTAVVEYKLPLPPGTPMAGAVRQDISLPATLSA